MRRSSDVLSARGLVPASESHEARALVVRIVQMLTKLQDKVAG